MTKPISHHLTTGTFNYVVKDPNCFRLSGQLWIKDQPGRNRIRVLELDGAVYFVCLAAGSRVLLLRLGGSPRPVHSNHRTRPNLTLTSRVTQQQVTFCANFSRLSEFHPHVNQNSDFLSRKSARPCGFPSRKGRGIARVQSDRDQPAQRPAIATWFAQRRLSNHPDAHPTDAEHSAPDSTQEHSAPDSTQDDAIPASRLNSTAQWLGFAVRSASPTGRRPRSNTWTALRLPSRPPVSRPAQFKARSHIAATN